MNLKTDLFEHQERAINKIKDLKAAALFMDMGTGKTRTALEFISYKKEKIDQVLWICPVRTKFNLMNEINKHSYYKSEFIEKYNNEFICIIGIETISQSDRQYLKIDKIIKNNCLIIVDESHYIKNIYTKRTMRINYLSKKSKYRLIMTGTPIPNGIQDFYSQFYFLHPDILGYNSFFSFASNHLEYSEKYKNVIVRAHNTEYITRKINPYIFQVKKEDCLELPKKTYTIRNLYLNKKQDKLYDYVKNEILSKVESDFNSYELFKLFLYLTRITQGYFNYKIDKNYHRMIDYSKVELLKEVLEEIDTKNNKVVIFYQYKSDVSMIRKKLKIKLEINGSISLKKQAENIKELEEKENIILVNIKSGSTGLNLQMCNYIIFFNNTFDYSRRKQAEDRVYRIGQNKNVHIIDLVTWGTIEEYIIECLNKKVNVSKSIMNEIRKIQENKEEIENFKKILK